MRNKLIAGVGAVVVVALLATNPLVADAAGKIDGKMLKNNSVAGTKIKDGSLQSADFAAGQIPAGPAGPAGAAGPKGATGNAGPAGPGFDDFAYYEDTAVAVPANTDDFIISGDCPTGQTVVTAFAYWVNHNQALQVSVDPIDATTMGAQVWSDGIPDVDDVVLQWSCATLPLPARPAGQPLTGK